MIFGVIIISILTSIIYGLIGLMIFLMTKDMFERYIYRHEDDFYYILFGIRVPALLIHFPMAMFWPLSLALTPVFGFVWCLSHCVKQFKRMIKLNRIEIRDLSSEIK